MFHLVTVPLYEGHWRCVQLVKECFGRAEACKIKWPQKNAFSSEIFGAHFCKIKERVIQREGATISFVVSCAPSRKETYGVLVRVEKKETWLVGSVGFRPYMITRRHAGSTVCSRLSWA